MSLRRVAINSAELGLASCHRLALRAQAFMPLPLGRDCEPQLVQLFG